MEKIFTIVPRDEKLILNVEGNEVELLTNAIIPSWDKANNNWFWRINVEDPSKNKQIRTAKYMVSTELYVDGALEYAGRDVAIGRNGTGIILGSGKPYVRAVDITVVQFMRDNDCRTLLKNPPSSDRYRKSGFSIQFRVFDIQGSEQLPIAGSFMLDPEKPWIVAHRKVQLSTVSEWRGLYVPNGYKFREAKDTSMEEVADRLVDAIEHLEEASIPSEEEHESVATIGDAIGPVLDQVVPSTDTPSEECPITVENSQA